MVFLLIICVKFYQIAWGIGCNCLVCDLSHLSFDSSMFHEDLIVIFSIRVPNTTKVSCRNRITSVIATAATKCTLSAVDTNGGNPAVLINVVRFIHEQCLDISDEAPF